MSFKSSALRIATAIIVSFSATTAMAGDVVVKQVDRDTFHYSIATPANGKVAADRAKVLRDAQKLASALGAGGYSIVRESSHKVDGAIVREVDIKLNGAARR